MSSDADHPDLRHRGRILHLVVVNTFVGAMVGLERTVLPLVAEADFGITSTAAALSFIATFGLTKALVNFFAGALSERHGRKPILVTGWLVGLPVPLVLMWAPSWGWVLFANVLLGVNQALAWSMTVVMKVDLARPQVFGRVIGWNEFAGYVGLAATAAATGWIASTFGLRPAPFYMGVVLAAVGLILSLATKETAAEGRAGARPGTDPRLPLGSVLARGTWGDLRLAAASTAGLVTNLKDGVLWGLLPVVLTREGIPLDQVGIVVGSYPLAWATSQLYFGPLSDRVGRRGPIVGGLVVQAIGVAMIAAGGPYGWYLAAAVTVGVGTGMVYPTLLAFVSDVADPAWRASALGVYRLWRDLGYAVGALGGGLLADAFGITSSVTATAATALAAAAVFVGLARRG